MAPTTDVHADVKVVLTIEISEELKALLTAQGWTPPGAVHEPPTGIDYIPLPAHRRVLGDQADRHNAAMRDLRARHQQTITRMVEDHERAQEREEKRIRAEYSASGRHDGCVTWADHTAALRDRADHVRRTVAEEIAVDLEKPREWRITLDKPGPWAAVARKHAGGKPSEIPFPVDQSMCFACGHLAERHSHLAGGCAGVGSLTTRCNCTLNHGNR